MCLSGDLAEPECKVSLTEPPECTLDALQSLCRYVTSGDIRSSSCRKLMSLKVGRIPPACAKSFSVGRRSEREGLPFKRAGGKSVSVGPWLLLDGGTGGSGVVGAGVR